jgi:hypothetical protein|tara:strand:- start:110 stop:229 length:120 start_codon:yes stop_codon:yes gene_type:complete
MYQLYCEKGVYTEDTFGRLVLTVLKHRLIHFLKGEGFKD